MHTEYEATYYGIDKEEFRKKLKTIGAELIREEFLQKRVNFNLPPPNDKCGIWCRVRDEGDKITMSYKNLTSESVDGMKEICVEVDDFENAVNLLSAIGCIRKNYQETKRELWMVNDIEIYIDSWPWLKPIVEIEGPNEAKVKYMSDLLGFNWEEAIFAAADKLYVDVYGITKDEINNKTPELTFEKQPWFVKD